MFKFIFFMLEALQVFNQCYYAVFCNLMVCGLSDNITLCSLSLLWPVDSETYATIPTSKRTFIKGSIREWGSLLQVTSSKISKLEEDFIYDVLY